MKNVIWEMENETRLSKLGLVSESKGEQGVFARQAEFGADVRAVVFDGDARIERGVERGFVFVHRQKDYGDRPLLLADSTRDG